MDQPNVVTKPREPWNKGKLVGQKAPFKLKEIWAIRIRLQPANCARDLALFDLAIDSKLRACDLVRLRMRDVSHGDRVAARTIVMQQKTRRPVQFEITEQTREAVARWIDHAKLQSEDFLFPSRCITQRTCRPGSTRVSSMAGCKRSAWILLPTARTLCGAPRRR